MASRDLTLAKESYDTRDVEMSIKAHEAKTIESATEDHSGAGDYVKSLVFGGLDGIITTFAIVAAVAGSGLSPDVVILMGVANLLADGISMGLGDYLSEKAENRFVKHERDREMWETNNFLDGEIKEMIEIYMNKGLSEEDASLIINTMVKYKDFFVDHMIVMELGLMPVEDEDDAWKKGLVTFFFVPLIWVCPSTDIYHPPRCRVRGHKHRCYIFVGYRRDPIDNICFGGSSRGGYQSKCMDEWTFNAPQRRSCGNCVISSRIPSGAVSRYLSVSYVVDMS